MPFYLTRDPVPSADMRNVFDNAQNLDLALNDLTSSLWTDRLGRSRMSWFGLESAFSVKLSDFESRFTSQIVEQEATFDASQADKENRFQHFLVSSGYVFLGDYEDGPFQFSARNQYIRYNNQYYRLNAATDVGFTTTGTDATSFANDVTHFVLMDGDTLRQNLGSGEPGMGSDMLAFRDMLGRSSTVGDYLRDAYIRVHSRYELLQAIEHINNEIQHPTEIRLARNFASWNDAKTDIDITYASIVGEGGNVVIDAQGIPDAAGNYFMRIFNSKKSDINNLANIFTVKQQGFTVIGPSRNSNVAFNVFHSPEGQGAGFMTLGITAQEFGVGDTYGQNAYIIKHIGRAIQRCVNHVWMPSGYSNYGEGISYAHSLLSTSSGVGIRNDNPNGAIRLFDCSLDYMGRIAVTNGGRIEIIGCHTEVNNASNKLTGIPFETASSERAEIVVSGGEILGFSTPLPASVPTIFRCGANTNG
ncbi:hypothetical protein ACEOSJ_005121, partial [Klebsiella pneumoniae]